MSRRLPVVVLALSLVALVACGEDDETASPPPAPAPTAAQTTTAAPPSTTESAAPPTTDSGEPDLRRAQGEAQVSTLVTGLEVPWDMAFLPDGRALVTERPGRVRLLSAGGELAPAPAAEVAVNAAGEGGLLGIAVDPEFADNGFVYLYRTTDAGNEVARYRLRGDRLTDETMVLDGIQAAAVHDGGRLRFSPDGDLYVTTGDAAQPELSQDPQSLNGKILRLRPASFRGAGGDAEVFSLGHRNPQGLDWDPDTGRLVSDEHGPSGNDELNLIAEGANYGWPEVEGPEHGDFTAPAALYDPSIAPSGSTFVALPGSAWTGDYLFGALAGEQLRRVRIEGDEVTVDKVALEGLGRIRVVVEGPDGALYLLTNNTDGRGSPRQGDDRIVRVIPPAG